MNLLAKLTQLWTSAVDAFWSTINRLGPEGTETQPPQVADSLEFKTPTGETSTGIPIQVHGFHIRVRVVKEGVGTILISKHQCLDKVAFLDTWIALGGIPAIDPHGDEWLP